MKSKLYKYRIVEITTESDIKQYQIQTTYNNVLYNTLNILTFNYLWVNMYPRYETCEAAMVIIKDHIESDNRKVIKSARVIKNCDDLEQ